MWRPRPSCARRSLAPRQVSRQRARNLPQARMSFHKRLAEAALTEDNQRNGPLDARAAPRVFYHRIVRRSNERRLAHVHSKEMQFAVAVALEGDCLAHTPFRRGGIVDSAVNQFPARLQRARLWRNPTRLMLAEARSVFDISVAMQGWRLLAERKCFHDSRAPRL